MYAAIERPHHYCELMRIDKEIGRSHLLKPAWTAQDRHGWLRFDRIIFTWFFPSSRITQSNTAALGISDVTELYEG